MWGRKLIKLNIWGGALRNFVFLMSAVNNKSGKVAFTAPNTHFMGLR
jgi:hypothetical protein